MFARITAYNGRLVCELLVEASVLCDVRIPHAHESPFVIGQVIPDTARNLGVSAEALELLKQVRKGPDIIGDIDWFRGADGIAHFGWIGPCYAIKDPTLCTSSWTYQVLDHVRIPN